LKVSAEPVLVANKAAFPEDIFHFTH
jgi:hypothetical protein